MVSDEPRLPGVQAPGWLRHGLLIAGGRATHARPVGLSTSLYRIQPEPERSVRDARFEDLNPSSQSAVRSATRIRVAEPTFWSRRCRHAVRPHDARRVAICDATGASAQWR